MEKIEKTSLSVQSPEQMQVIPEEEMVICSTSWL